ncbi:hypothetical protein K491DRAFT_591111 [Lophiostoma macrostomum CBS 122681]|uniref:Zn(2)-C6 fungal-type domain-containing protein n=1 Tax=Lophiostoma macrostomum CBS 122681 TaxID=1314788 RepID=A0A6A6TKA2_9PLEO|nr:hypothetical protein K491DRAFT_591111 [Lophiostoma macrostomum CBS 122681]
MAESARPLPSRRNLPRASHACERCRTKKAKCDQRQPCANCISHAEQCVYGLRRRNGRLKNGCLQNSGAQGADTQDQVLSPRSAGSGRGAEDETPRRHETIGQNHSQNRSILGAQSLPVDHPHAVDDVNQHTQGTEFYGTSSNFVLLNRFFAYAQQHLPSRHAGSGDYDSSYLSPASGVSDSAPLRNPVSIVDLLSNEEALEPASRPKTPTHSTEDQQHISIGTSSLAAHSAGVNHRSTQDESDASLHRNGSTVESVINPPNPSQPSSREKPLQERTLQTAKMRIEREYVRLFMNNLHHIHPMLDPIAFTARCEEVIWNSQAPLRKDRALRHFFALYNIVVAVGALVAGSSISQGFERDINICLKHSTPFQELSLPLSSLSLSKAYFRKSRASLGDVFEVCSLESAQALLLMSLYCQNSLKPHACYLYCGHAVRTALAIGIARECTSYTVEDRKAARRTWWCIYSHEIDMSCSAGRRDSLGKPRNYQILLPCIRDQTLGVVSNRSELENRSVEIINEMVHFATILQRISKELYYDSKGLSLSEKSELAKELDALLNNWKAQLPEHLHFSRISFREEEWSSKQKLVLHLRHLNARILLHRPFLEEAASRTHSGMSGHVDSCLDASRATIRVMYDAYTNRHYFRTWWYNSTYTLYAGMIVLYIVMLGHLTVSDDELLDDAIKAQDILQSMEETVVARRSADLIREGLEVARACVQGRQSQFASLERIDAEQGEDHFHDQSNLNHITNYTGDDFSRALLSRAVPGQEPALWASMIDPNLLQDFTAADKDMPGVDFSAFSFDGLYGDGLDVDLTFALP